MGNDIEVLRRLFVMLEEYYATRKDRELIAYRPPSELNTLLSLDRASSEGDWDSVFGWIEQYLDYSVKTSHPAFVNRMWAGANLPSILGEMVAAISNTSACTYESAPVSTLLERYMIRQMLDLAGFRRGEGQMTTGSSNANMIAMMCARNRAGSGVKEQGLFGQRPIYGFVNADAHYSMDKAANILGIGSDHLIKIPVNGRGEMDIAVLERELAQVEAADAIPFFVAATEGTTVRGAYDPIEPILQMREKYGFWLHADGAWGGAVVMSDGLRRRFMPGLEQVDSFTWDFHKMLGSSLMCNVLLLNGSTNIFGQVLGGGDGSYLFRDTEDEEVNDLGTVSLQCGRRVDSLKWFLDWKFYGKAGFGARIEKYLELCEYAEQCIHRHPELELVAPRVSFNLCFRYRGPEQTVNEFNRQLRTRLYQQGLGLIGIGFIGDTLALRLLIANTSIDRPEIDQFFDNLVKMGRQLAEGA